MSEFKLIAIKTGDTLTTEEFSPVNTIMVPKENYNYLKNLKPNKAFVFFNDYEISEDSTRLIHKAENSIPNIYKLENNPNTNIEISAIVGRNGSGKSSLIEILYLAIHNLAIKAEVLYDIDKNLIIEPQNYLRCELFVLIDKNTAYKIKLDYDDSTRRCYLFKSTKSNNSFAFKSDAEEIEKEDLASLFYTISVNYSIYGLNSQQIGSWINHLFHKNDSYQTPLVINPMRNDGNFDINRENYLFKYRLLSNATLKYKKTKNDVEIVDGIKLHELVFKIDRTKIQVLEAETQFDERQGELLKKERTIEQLLLENKLDLDLKEMVALTIKELFDIDFKNSVSIEYEKEVHLYIIKKLYRIAFNYSKYWDYLEFGLHGKPIMFETYFHKTKFIDYLKALSFDHTHVTLKLRQALNYLINNPLKTYTPDEGTTRYWFESTLTGKIYRIPFNEMADKLLGFSDKIINCLPPSLFKILINVYKDKKENYFDISKLSSGELQLTQSIQSSLYHLNNLESYDESKDDNSIKYENVLLLFDEVELYFHPEYQRKIVSNFISEVDQLDLKLIKNIHVIYITHSPFVLSDIPHINQLHVKNGNVDSIVDKTFAGNIYELLQSTFYLESNIGDYAERVIDEVLGKLYEIRNLINAEKIDEIALSKLKEDFEEREYLKIIKLIGDRIVKNKMLDIYFECFREHDLIRREFLESQIKKFQKELKKHE